MPSITLAFAAAAMAPATADQPPPAIVLDLIEAIKAKDETALDRLTGGIVGYDIYSSNPQKVGADRLMADLAACRHVKTEEWEPKFWMTTWLCDAGVEPDKYCDVPAYGVQISWRLGPNITAYFKEDQRTDKPCKAPLPRPPKAAPPLPAELTPPAPAAVKQLADAVTSGATLAGSAHASHFSEAQIRWLAGLKGCASRIHTAAIPGTPMTAVIHWQCAAGQPASTAVMLSIERDRIVRVTPLGDFAKAK